jgi:hypothetical protein
MCLPAYHAIMIITCHRIRCTVCIFTYKLHHTGSEELQVAVQEEQSRTDPQEIQAQEVLEEEEQGEDLPECVDQPSSFERVKPQSIISLLLYKSNSLFI